MITCEEKEIMLDLAAIWNKFIKLPVEHPDDTEEFRHSFHSLQHKILKRSGTRELKSL